MVWDLKNAEMGSLSVLSERTNLCSVTGCGIAQYGIMLMAEARFWGAASAFLQGLRCAPPPAYHLSSLRD